MERLAECENSIVGKRSQSFCDDGDDFLLLDDGWKWVRVEGGYSRQEGLAMGHCGNYYAKKETFFTSFASRFGKTKKWFGVRMTLHLFRIGIFRGDEGAGQWQACHCLS